MVWSRFAFVEPHLEITFMPPLFLPMLIGWCALWTVLAAIRILRGFGASGTETARSLTGFWGMTLFWIAIDAGIAGWAVMDPVTDVAEFRKLLLINGCLDVVYLIVGFVLIARVDPLVRGFGRAIILQGGFLLVFDFIWWWCLAGSSG